MSACGGDECDLTATRDEAKLARDHGGTAPAWCIENGCVRRKAALCVAEHESDRRNPEKVFVNFVSRNLLTLGEPYAWHVQRNGPNRDGSRWAEGTDIDAATGEIVDREVMTFP